MLFRVIDFETTGLGSPPNTGVVEIGWSDVTAGDGPTRIDGPYNTLTNPGIPIEVGAMAVHHIQNEDIQNAHHPDEHLGTLHEAADFIVAHNAAFEQKFYVPPIPVICTMKVAYRLFPEAMQHTNQYLRYHFGFNKLDPDKCLPAHRAGPDTYVTARNLIKMLEKAIELKIPISEFVKWSAEPPVLPRCPIGQHRGKPWSEVDNGFLNWMLRQPTMESDLKWNARRALRERGYQV